jgi:hypothetical protein
MATLNWREGTDAIAAQSMGEVAVIRIPIDCATNNVGSGDTVQLMDIPQNFFVESVEVQIEAHEGATGTIDLGDAGSAAAYLNNGDVNSANGTVLHGDGSTGAGACVKKLYTAETVLTMLANNALDTFVGTIAVKGYFINQDYVYVT